MFDVGIKSLFSNFPMMLFFENLNSKLQLYLKSKLIESKPMAPFSGSVHFCFIGKFNRTSGYPDISTDNSTDR